MIIQRYEHIRTVWCQRKQLTKETELLLTSGMYEWMIGWAPYGKKTDTRHHTIEKKKDIDDEIQTQGFIHILTGMILTLIKENVV